MGKGAEPVILAGHGRRSPSAVAAACHQAELDAEVERLRKQLALKASRGKLLSLKDDKIPDKVLEGLYIGSIGAARSLDALPESLRLTPVLNAHRAIFYRSLQIYQEGSATLVLAYLITYEHMTLEAAMELLRSVRPVVRPNSGFMQQLLEYSKQLGRPGDLEAVQEFC
ncbi:hypothetical protein WJX72_001127 [[Myrmecia] bisecta]|uniref:protein-tyrosine-phosphatase n=1 Tax=[Myrmecia] bisecta TaxID=41462 RepID=A0AAW1P3U4_9CHLO